MTGAASGIGRALAERLAAEGMKVVLSDIDRDRLLEAESRVRRTGAAAVAIPADVSRAGDVDALARGAREAFGAVHLVVNDAGVVSPPAASWEKRLEDWELVLGVDLWGVIHGIRAFVPILLSQGTEGHVVNIASGAGLICGPFAADYLAAKHAVVSISESLQLELEARKSRVKVSVVCPGFVRTGILDALERRSGSLEVPPDLRRRHEEHRRLLAESTPPSEIADRVVEAVRAERFYVFPHPEIKTAARARFEDLLAERGPRSA